MANNYIKESHGFDEENEYILGLSVVTNERILEDDFEEEGLEVDWDYISKVSAELDYAIERKFAKEIGHVAVEEFHDDEGYHCTFWVRNDDIKVMKYLNNLNYFDNYHYDNFTAKLVDVDEICDNEIDKLEKKYDSDILGILRECVSVWIEVPTESVFESKESARKSMKESHKYNDSISLYDNLYNCNPKEMPSDDFLADLLDFAETYDRDYNKKIDELINMNCGEWFYYVIEYSPKAK